MITKYLPGPGKAKAATTAETIRWNESETLSGSAVKEIHIDMSGSNNDMDALTLIEVFAGGQPIIRLNELQIAAWLSTLGKRAYAAAADTRFTIPFNWGSMGCAAPPGKALAVALTTDNTGGAVTFRIGYTVSDAPANAYPMLLANAGNVGASQSFAQYNITQPGILRGIILPRTTSITAARLYLGGELAWDFPSLGLLLQAQDYASGTTTTLNKLLQLPQPVPVIPGATRIELSTDGSFAAADEIVVWTDVPYAA